MPVVNPIYRISTISFGNKNNQNSPVVTKRSHAGLYTGLAAASVHGLSDILATKFLEKAGVNFQKSAYAKYFAIPFVATSFIATGFLTDKLIQAKNKEYNNKIAGKTTQEAIALDKRGRATKKGNPYYNSNTGKKSGAVIGTIMLPLLKMITSKNLGSIRLNAIYAVGGLIGGTILGAVTDKFANKMARKNADKAYQTPNT